MKGKAKIEKIFSMSNNMYIHSHISYSEELEYTFARHKHLMMLRNPRALAVSWMRHRVKENSDLRESKELLIGLIKGGMFGESIPRFYSNFFGWVNVSNIHIIKFEDFISRSHKIESTEKYLALKTGTLNYDDILGSGSTYTGKYSEWEEWWCEEVESVWHDAGGEHADSFIAGYYSQTTR
ncbi:sulfotransferase domain-containing protein [Halomonas sp. ML-15]|nr:sulfotransferase domain-containing protein [Halomonas sp. ML-15]MBD3896227.1 sulfotransferase domain-containing protein [Halomonas sp. ML-15]